MKTRQNKKDNQEAEQDRIDYQLDLLKLEINYIEESVWRLIEVTQTTKNWAVVTWAGSIGLLLGQEANLSKYVIFTAIPPIIFWFVDAHWRHLQRRASYRGLKIREFLNDERLLESLKQKRLVDFMVYDPTGRQYTGIPEAEKFSSRSRTFKYPELMWFYLPMILISLIIGIIFIFGSIN